MSNKFHTMRARAKLSEDEAASIFMVKLEHTTIPTRVVASSYGMSEKAVRDIWNGRTWAKVTSRIIGVRRRPVQPVGRPLGRKDSKPRIKMAKSGGTGIDEQLFVWETEPPSLVLEDPFQLDFFVQSTTTTTSIENYTQNIPMVVGSGLCLLPM